MSGLKFPTITPKVTVEGEKVIIEIGSVRASINPYKFLQLDNPTITNAFKVKGVDVNAEELKEKVQSLIKIVPNLAKQTYKRLLDEIPNQIEFDSIPSPAPAPSGGDSRRIIVFKSSIEPNSLNQYLPTIRQMFSVKGFNFTYYKAQLWMKHMKVSKPIGTELALLIPDIVSPPLTDLGVKEHPHLGIYLWGAAGGGRTTIGKLLQEQWLYSLVLSETGFDSDIGILWVLSQANRDLLLIGSDIGSATIALKDWQRKLPATIVNIIWDGREVRTTKVEGSIEVINKGMAFYGGGNRPLGQSEFSVKDVSRIIQNQMPSTKDVMIELLIARAKGKTELDNLVHPVIFHVHHLNALIMQGKVKSPPFNGRKPVIDIDDEIRKQVLASIIENYAPELTKGISDDDIWINSDEFISKARALAPAEDTNAILRLYTMACMLIRDTVIDNLLIRPYTLVEGKMHIKAIEEDLQVCHVIMDREFWNMKRYEYKYTQLYKEITPDYFTPVEYYYKLLAEAKQMLSPTVLYDMAKERLVEGNKMTEAEFNAIYGDNNSLSKNFKLQKAVKRLEIKPNVSKIDGHPVKYMIVSG